MLYWIVDRLRLMPHNTCHHPCWTMKTKDVTDPSLSTLVYHLMMIVLHFDLIISSIKCFI